MARRPGPALPDRGRPKAHYGRPNKAKGSRPERSSTNSEHPWPHTAQCHEPASERPPTAARSETTATERRLPVWTIVTFVRDLKPAGLLTRTTLPRRTQPPSSLAGRRRASAENL